MFFFWNLMLILKQTFLFFSIWGCQIATPPLPSVPTIFPDYAPFPLFFCRLSECVCFCVCVSVSVSISMSTICLSVQKYSQELFLPEFHDMQQFLDLQIMTPAILKMVGVRMIKEDIFGGSGNFGITIW